MSRRARIAAAFSAGRGDREEEIGPRAFARRAGEHEAAAQLRREAVDHRQAEPGSPSVSLVEKKGSTAWASVTSSMPTPASITDSRI